MDNLPIREDSAFSKVQNDQYASFIPQFKKKLGEYFKDVPYISKYQLIPGEVDRSWNECLSEGLSYTFPLKLVLKSGDSEQEYTFNVPLPTPRGTFVIEGQERIAKRILRATDISKDKKERKHLSQGEKTRDLRFYEVVVVDFYSIFIKFFLKISEKASRSQQPDKTRKKNKGSYGEFFPYFPRYVDLYLEIFNSQPGIEQFPFLDSTNPLSEVEHMRKLTFTRGERTRDGRDIHPTHYGRLCVVETPESEKIGMRLHLAHKARVEDGKILSPRKVVDNDAIQYVRPEQDAATSDSLTELKESVLARNVNSDGSYVDASEVQYTDAFDDQIFGYAALQVPFIQHNDPARALMGAKNLKQAVPLRDPEIPIIKTGYEKEVAEISGRTIRAERSGRVVKVSAHGIVISSENEEQRYSYIKGVPSVLSKTAFFQKAIVKKNEVIEAGQIIAEGAGIVDGSLALGVNALVAYMPFFGYNMDDGMVISERLAERLTSVHIEEFVVKTKKGDIPKWWAYEGLKLQISHKGLQIKGLEERGEWTRTPIAVLERIENRKKEEVTIYAQQEMLGGIIRKAIIESDRIRFWVQKDRKLEVGDKLMGRHGNKGVVAKIFPTDQMPYVEVQIKGKKEKTHIDLLLNPHSVITRMNIGQIYETHFGWIAKEHPNGEVRNKAMMIGKPFSKVDFGCLAQWFEESGLDSRGKITVKLADGNETANPVVVGYQYIVKLNHLASSKLSIRGETGPVSYVTDLPLSGKKNEGGQRVGEMEVWALLAHGAVDILKDMLGLKSNAHVLDPKTKTVSVSESLRVLIYYLRGLGIAFDVFDKEEKQIDAENFYKTKRKEIKMYSIAWADPARMMSWGCHWHVPERMKTDESVKEYLERKRSEVAIVPGAKNILTLNDLYPEFKEQMGYISLAENMTLCGKTIEILPVIPMRCRPRESSALSKLYKKIFTSNSELIELKSADKVGTDDYKTKVRLLQKKIERLEDELASLIKGKRGIVRKAILGKRVNFSGRAVIVPDPRLPADSAIVPQKMIREMQKIIKNPSGERTTFQKVLLNRQPTLHIHNIQAFDAMPGSDNAIAINPLVCGGFNADFDGDTMAVYMTDKPIPDGMHVHENIFLAANGKLNLNLSQDIMAGIYYASGTEEGKKELEKLIADKDLFNAERFNSLMGKDTVLAIMQKHFLQHNDRIKTLRFAEQLAMFGLEWATFSGLTFGIFDLDELSIRPHEKKTLHYDTNEIEKIMKGRIAKEENLTNPISIMMLSGARGDIKQLRQMAGIKGIVDRLGGGKTSAGVNSSYLEGLSPNEYYLACFGARNSLGDKKLMTPQCGYLTRRLVYAAFDITISETDCGTKDGFPLEVDRAFGRTLLGDVSVNSTVITKDTIITDEVQEKMKKHNIATVEVRSPLTCKSKKGICGKCYGWHLSRRELPKTGFSAGIMAAELIGERATQDAMRTYHRGIATGTIKLFDETGAIFDNSEDPKSGKKISEGIKDIPAVFGLARTLFENYEKKVDIKHYEVMLKALVIDSEFRGTKEVIRNKGLLHNASFERAVTVFMDYADKDTDAWTACNALEKLFT